MFHRHHSACSFLQHQGSLQYKQKIEQNCHIQTYTTGIGVYGMDTYFTTTSRVLNPSTDTWYCSIPLSIYISIYPSGLSVYLMDFQLALAASLGSSKLQSNQFGNSDSEEGLCCSFALLTEPCQSILSSFKLIFTSPASFSEFHSIWWFENACVSKIVKTNKLKWISKMNISQHLPPFICSRKGFLTLGLKQTTFNSN